MCFGKTHGLKNPAGQVFSDSVNRSELNQRRLRKPIHIAFFMVSATTGIISTNQCGNRYAVDLNKPGLTSTEGY